MPVTPLEADRTLGYWHLRLARELKLADRDVGFAGVLKLLMMFESIYAYSAELAAGGSPE